MTVIVADFSASQLAHRGDCLAVPDVLAAPVCHHANRGTDGRWHLVHPVTGVIACRRQHRASLDPSRPARRIRPKLRIELEPGSPFRDASTVPLAERCDQRLGGMWPRYVAVPNGAPSRWPTATPPLWFVWTTLYRLQHYRCAACRLRPPHGVDYDPVTGRIRGLLCWDCNTRQQHCRHEPDCYRAYLLEPPAAAFGWIHPRSVEARGIGDDRSAVRIESTA
jgi:hypothetical protein